MYRHVAVLVDAGVLEVTDEKRIRGTVERTYRVRWDRTELGPADRAAMSSDDHRRAFTAFVGGILADFDGYLSAEPADPTADGVTYGQAALWLTDGEMRDIVAELHAAVAARQGHGPDTGRTLRQISLIAMPDRAGAPRA